MSRPGRLRGILLAVLLAGAAGPAGAQPAESAPELVPIPRPALEQVDEAVRRQLEEVRREADQLLAGGAAAAPEARAQAAETVGTLGRLYFLYDLPDAAEAALANAHRLAPEEFRWAYYLGAVRQQAHRAAAAVEAFETALALRPGELPVLLRLGEVELSRGDAAAARGWFERARAVDPDSAAALHGLARLAALEGDWPTAASLLAAVLERQPEATRVHYELGMAYRELGDLDRAREQLARQGQGEVRFADPLVEELAALVSGSGVYMVSGNSAFARGDWALAAEAYRRAVAAAPDDLTARQSLASALARAGRPEAALEELAEVLRRDPDNAFAHYNVATLEVARGRTAEALPHFEAALAAAPDFADAHFNLATALEQLGHFAEAEEHYAASLELEPEDRQARLHHARVLLRLDRAAAAAAEARTLLATDPGDARAHFTLGEALERSGQTAAAADSYRAVVDSAGGDDERGMGHLALGRLLAAAGDGAAAADHLRSASELLPDLDQPPLLLAQVLGRERRFAEAAEAFATALARQPANEGARFGRALALLLAGRDGEARRHLEDSLAVLPGSLALKHVLARLLAASPEPAARDGRRALELAREVFAAQQTLDHAETVAMAHAEAGDFDQAVAWQRQILDRARQTGDAATLERLAARLALYERGEPCRAPWLDGV